MFGITGILGRIVYAVLVGVVTFLVVYVIGALLVQFGVSAGTKVEQFAALVGLLVALVAFFTRSTPTTNV